MPTETDRNWHYLYSLTSAGEKDLSNVTQIRAIGLMEPKICTKMFKTLSEKLGAKFPATTRGYSMVQNTRLNDAFLEVFQLQASPGRRSITAAKRKREKGQAKKEFKKSKSLKT